MSDDSQSPYVPPAPDEDKSTSQLGSLTQSARGTQLNSARNILLFVGILTVAVNGVLIFMLKDNLRAEIDQLRRQGMELIVDEDTVLRMAYLIQGSAIALGVLFIIFGLLVKTYPVPITISALVIYVAATAIFGLIEPRSLVAGIIWKVIIIVCLISAIRTALAYERERATSGAYRRRRKTRCRRPLNAGAAESRPASRLVVPIARLPCPVRRSAWLQKRRAATMPS